MKFFNRDISFTRTLVGSLLLMVMLCFQVNAQENRGLASANDPKAKVEVFPNPTTQYLTIDLSNLSLKDPKIEIRNIIGSKMVSHTEDIGRKQYKVDVQDYPPGYYLVLVRDDRSKFQQTVRFSQK